jgi:hypothetical protein
MANLKDGTIVNGSVTGNLNGNADTASNLYINELKSGTDLNTLTTTGLYVSANTANNITNGPSDVASFINTAIKVDSMGGSYIRQYLFGYDMVDGACYIRNYNGSTWTDWNKLIAVDPE